MTIARDLSLRLAEILRREHGAAADFLVAVADFDARRLWIELGYASLFMFLHRELGLSKGAAFYKKTGAALVQQYPEIVEALRDGTLCTSSLPELAKVITHENRADVLPRFFHRSKREAAEIVAELKPVEAPPRRAVVAALRPAPAAEFALPPANASEQPAVLVHPVNLPHANSANGDRPTSRPDSKPPVVEPLTADLRRFHLTVSKRFLAKLEAARDALSHVRPGATPEQILEAGLDLLLERDAKRKGIVAGPRKTSPASNTDRVPAEVRRTVFLRDRSRCQVPLASGGVCGSTYRVQLGHRTPKARGGKPTVENLRCECEVHNQYQADLDFGSAYMERFRRRRVHSG